MADRPASPSELARYADLFQRMLDAAILVERQDYRVIELNPAAERLFEKVREQVFERSVIDWITPDDRSAVERELRVCRRRYYPREVTARWLVGDQTHIMQMALCGLEPTLGEPVLQIIARDVSRQHEMETQAAEYLRQIEAANRRLEHLATVDEMTGLYNFRHFRYLLEREHARACRYDHPYAVVFFDIDHFKNYNDENGHPAGDTLLRDLGELLRRSCRSTDTVARYGGEEFALLCPSTTRDQAVRIAERLCATVADHPFPHGDSQPLGRITVSIGVAAYPMIGVGADDVLKAADDALYVSKKCGRNRVSSTLNVAA